MTPDGDAEYCNRAAFYHVGLFETYLEVEALVATILLFCSVLNCACLHCGDTNISGKYTHYGKYDFGRYFLQQRNV